jgi:hypothetical protein
MTDYYCVDGDTSSDRFAGNRLIADYWSLSPGTFWRPGASGDPPDCCSPPGCGKSTIAYPLVSHVNALLGGDEAAICISLDGWHYSRAELDRMPDPVEAHWRRVGSNTP